MKNNETEPAELHLDITPAEAKFDVGMVVAKAKTETDKYMSLVVTEDSIAQVKKDCTELNKVGSLYDRARIDGIKLATAPLEPIEIGLKKCAKMYFDTRQELLDRIDVYEVKYREATKIAIASYLDQSKKMVGLVDEFDTIVFDDLIKKSGNLTKTGLLTKPTRDEIDSRVNACYVIQVETTRRLNELSDYCTNRGLLSGLGRHSIFHILPDDTTRYYEELNKLIDEELIRQKEIEAKAKKQAEFDAEYDQLKQKAIKLQELTGTESIEQLKEIIAMAELNASIAPNSENDQKMDHEDAPGTEIDDKAIVGVEENTHLQPLDEADHELDELRRRDKTGSEKCSHIDMIVTLSTAISVPVGLSERYPDQERFKQEVARMVVQNLSNAGIKSISNVVVNFK